MRLWWERASWVLPLPGILAGGLLVTVVEFVDVITYAIAGVENSVVHAGDVAARGIGLDALHECLQ